MTHSNNSQSRKLIAGRKLRDSRKTNSNRIHIVTRGDQWVLKQEGVDRVKRIVYTKKEAIELANIYLKTGKSSMIVVHKKDGTIERVIKPRH